MRTFQKVGQAGTSMTGLALLVLSCSGPSSAPPMITAGEVKDGSASDVGRVQEGEVLDFVGRPDEAPLDATYEVAIPPGEPGYACTSSTDCFSGFCITTSNGQKCSVECLDECPFGWSCTLHKPSLPDETYICAPSFLNLCRPCNKNADCSTNGVDLGDTCIPFGSGGAFCGGDCETKSCPPEYDCQEIADVHGGASLQCIFTGIECPCADWFVDDGATTSCLKENEFGVCQGNRVCMSDGLTPCDAMEPQPESCNGLDDNCDTIIDEGTEWGDCVIDSEFGSCPGVHACQSGELVCEGQAPAQEDCDGEDNDCDEEIDEDFLNTDQDDLADCIDPDDDNDGDPDSTDCLPLDSSVSHYAEEACNGQDDNCSGSVDEGFIDTDFDGLKDCVDDDDDNDGDPDLTDCQPLDSQIHHDAEEECNGTDDDCNNEIDDGFGLQECGVGECLHQVPECADGELQSCNPFEGSSGELCDGKDNNCNDLVDDGFPVGQPCLVGLGLCAAAGVEVCAEDGQATECSAILGEPDCTGKECGDDGCGGVCGQCPGSNYACVAAVCVCQPDCGLKNCGDDGCGGSCGSCPAIEACNDGVCNGCSDGNSVPMDGCSGGLISKFLVNTEVASSQQNADVAALSDGGFVIVWESENQDGDGFGIFGQRFLPDGQVVGGEFLVNTDSYLNQEVPEVAGLASGGFVVVWQSEEFEGSDSSSVFARLYGPEGSALTDEFRVHVETAGWQRYPDVASLDGGGFVVDWETGGGIIPAYPDYVGILARLFDSDGQPQGKEFPVNTYTTDKQQRPCVGRIPDGFVAAWHSRNQDGNGWGIYAQEYTAQGNKVGDEYQVASTVVGDQWMPRCCGLSNGRVAVAWEGYSALTQDAEVSFSLFEEDGSILIQESLLNTVTVKIQKAGGLAALPSGGFVAAWESWGYSGNVSSAVLAQRFDNDGNKVGLDFQVSPPSWEMRRPSLAAFEDGSFIVVWDNMYHDGSGYGVFAQRFSEVGKKLYR
jgi:hypothetical protein